MSQTEVEIVLQRGAGDLPRRPPGSSRATVLSTSPGDFKEFVRTNGMTQVRARRCVWRMPPPQGSRQHEQTLTGSPDGGKDLLGPVFSCNVSRGLGLSQSPGDVTAAASVPAASLAPRARALARVPFPLRRSMTDEGGRPCMMRS